MRKSKTVLRGWPGTTITWQEVDLRLLTPAQRTAPGAFFEEDPSDAQVRIRKKEIVRNLRKSGLSYREVLKGEKVGYSRNYPPKSLLFSPFNEVGLSYLYPWDLHSRAKWSSLMIKANLQFYPPP